MLKTRGANNDSGLLYKQCGLSQYKGNIRYPISSYPLPLYENKHQIAIMKESLDKRYKTKRGTKHLILKKQDINSKDNVLQQIIMNNLD